ncbi:MAG TPA: serine/threonine-protein kinase [Polyangiaceae bacterium]|nr:serine/threonine-protein kinase [Polyangiaceae bacterium]
MTPRRPLTDPDAATLVRPSPAAGADREPGRGAPRPEAAAPGPARKRFEAQGGAGGQAPVVVDGAPWPTESAGFEARYELLGSLGEGGMGEVRLYRDRLVGREIALKALRPQAATAEGARGRFQREARVQGQLEHPALVPVYDLGVAPDGEAYFTMQRVRGRTLDEVVRRLAAGDADAAREYTRRRLLTALRSVCLAVDFAHRRGVLHRDLKPSNIILGDFGEVYVLDWGLAKVAGADDPAAGPAAPADDAAAGPTLAGTMLGTPGYMAPEQVRGEIDRLDPRADVYALGSILFEVVALERLHPGPSVVEVLASTVVGAEARASARGRPDVPPELEAICVRATELDPAERYPSARALSDDLERYLDGHRSEALRRDLSARHLEAARAALERAARGGPEAQGERARALGEAASALALEPGNAEALATMARLLVEVPAEVPPEAQAGLEQAWAAARREAGRTVASRLVLWVAFLPLALSMGVRSFAVAAVAIASVLGSGAIGWWVSRREAIGRGHGIALLAITTVAVAMASSLFGPFVLVPGLAATNAMSFALSSDARARRVTTAAAALSVLAPFALELAGLVPPSYAFRDGALLVLPRATELPPLQTTLYLALTSVMMVVVPALAVGELREQLNAAERRLYLQAWNLSQLVPSAARGGTLARLAAKPAP